MTRARVRTIRWIVRPGDGDTLSDILARAGAAPSAIASGSVFVGDRRIRDPHARVAPHDEITINEPEPDPEPASSTPTILHHAAGILAAHKPAGLPTIPDLRGDASLLAHVAAHVGLPLARVHPTSRLDRDVSGVVLFALDARARDLLRRAREEGRYARRYVALAAIPPDPPSGTWDAPIGRHPRNKLLRQVRGASAVPAETRYRVVERVYHACIVAVEPVTGRTHQIRVHASHAGAPLLGDRAYGGARRIVLATGEVIGVERIYLHAAKVVVTGSGSGSGSGRLDIRAEIPAEFADLWSKLGGSVDVWEKALSCEAR